MKKTLFVIATVAAGLFVASCGNKSENNQSAEAGEEKTETTATAKVAVPAGWKVNKDASSENVVNLDATEFGELESVYIFFNKELTSAEEMANQYLSGNESTKKMAEDVTIGGLKFKQLKAIDSADVNCELFAEANNGVLEVELSKNIPVDAPSLAKLIESITFK